MSQSPAIINNRLYALQRDGDEYQAAFYVQNGTSAKPEWREVSRDCHRALELKFGDYLDHMESTGGYEYKSYSVNAQIEADWGAELTEQIAVTETEASFLAGTRTA